MNIRQLEENDLKQFVGIACLALENAGISYNIDKIPVFFYEILNNDDFFKQVAITDTGMIAGILVGSISDNYFDDHLYGSETFWYVVEKYRGSLSSIRLLKNFEKWCKEKGGNYILLDILSTSSFTQKHKVFKYEEVGRLYRKEL